MNAGLCSLVKVAVLLAAVLANIDHSIMIYKDYSVCVETFMLRIDKIEFGLFL